MATDPENHPLRAWRKANNKTLQDVGDGVRRSPSQISELERGTKGVSLEVAIAIEAFTDGAVPATALGRAGATE